MLDEQAIKLGGTRASDRTDDFIKHLYDTYPRNPMNDTQFAMVYGAGEDQSIAVFDIRPSRLRPNTAIVHWVHTYPHRKGVGTKAFGELQSIASRYGVGLELYPWKHGPVSQAGLKRFYRRQGFKPINKGGTEMSWRPPVDEANRGINARDYDPSDEFYDPDERSIARQAPVVSMRKRYAGKDQDTPNAPTHRGVMKYVPSWDAYFYLSGHMQDRDEDPRRRVEKEDITRAIGSAMEKNRSKIETWPAGTTFVIRTPYRRSVPVIKTVGPEGKMLYVIKTVLAPGSRLKGSEPIIA